MTDTSTKLVDLAAALLKDVKRHGGWHALDPVPVMYETEVLAALTAALDPAIAERVQALTRRLRKTEEAGRVHHLSKADRLASADLITALLAQLAALRAERDALAAQVAEVTSDRAYIIGANDGWEAAVEQDVATPAAAAMLARAEAAEAKVEKLRGALNKLHHAVCGETGFAACVRLDSGNAYPWPALDDADETARAALTTEADNDRQA